MKQVESPSSKKSKVRENLKSDEIQPNNSIWQDVKQAVVNLKWFFAFVVFILISVVDNPTEILDQPTEIPSEQVVPNSTGITDSPSTEFTAI